ncbi:MAG TPA: alpha/beta fold hydrolase, partial [Myxococcaceae bacterium]|nr:alpha/beta fold hydrolase [Myxococcaceae bacterium]
HHGPRAGWPQVIGEPTFIDTVRGRFAAHLEGPSDGPPVLCLHGFPDNPSFFGPLLPALASAGYRAVAPFMRGYRPTQLGPPHRLADLGDDVEALAQAIAPGRTLAVVGHDWGAVAVHEAIARPAPRVHAAVAMAVPRLERFVANTWRHPGQLIRSGYMLEMASPLGPFLARSAPRLRTMWTDWSGSREPRDERLLSVRATLDASGSEPTRYYRMILAEVLRGGWRREVQIAVPTLLLMGARDGVIPPFMADGSERHHVGPFAMQVVPDAGHFLLDDAPAPVVAAVLDWIGRWPAARASR